MRFLKSNIAGIKRPLTIQALIAAAPIVVNCQNTIAGTSSTTMTLSSYTVQAGDGKILTVMVGNEAGSAVSVSTVKHNGVDLTKRVDVIVTSGASNGSELWDLQLGATTPSGDIVVTWGSSATARTVTACTLMNRAQQAPEATNSNTEASSSSINTSITTITSNAVIIDNAVQGVDDTLVITQGPDQVEDISVSVGGATVSQGVSHRVGKTTGSFTLGWSSGQTQRWAHVLAAYEVAPGAVPGGRIMGSLAGEGGLAGVGGIAGRGGGMV